MLLHNDAKHTYGAVPIGHSTKLKEDYESIKAVLEMMKYGDHKWVVCVDIKMVNFLLGQQSGFTKFPCFSVTGIVGTEVITGPKLLGVRDIV